MVKKKKNKNNDLQNTTEETKYWVKRTITESEGERRCSGMIDIS